MSKRNYDSEFCGSLPLHQINLIQSYGYLLVLDSKDLSILQVSENISDVFHEPVESLIGKPIKTYIDTDEINNLNNRFRHGITEKIPFSFTVRTGGEANNYVSLIHAKENYLIIEVEKAGQENSFLDVFQELKYIMAEINQTQSVKEASEVIVRQLKKLSGFDKVLMYQFDEDWNGTVIAEEKDEGMDSYMGLKFPASDIPRQARNLYLKNPYRLIPDRDYVPVRLYPVVNPASQTFIDLSDCNLRAVAGVHLEYMKNMGISASMSIRVIRNERLWGIISCHHRSPMYLNYEICSVFELLSSVISNRISSIENKEAFDFTSGLQERKTRLVEHVYAEKDVISGLFDHETKVSDLLNAGGAAAVYNGKIKTVGQVPGEDEVKNLIYWLQSKGDDQIYHTSSLPLEYDPAASFDKEGSGIVSIPIDSEKGNYIVLFRPEVVSTVNWGGNPDEAIRFEPNGKKYHPRNSFNRWQEIVKQTSESWKPEELEIAESMRSFIFEFTTKSL